MKIKNIKAVAGETKRLTKGGSEYLQLNFDKNDKRAFVNDFFDDSRSCFARYEDKNIIVIGNITKPMKMTEIEELINQTVTA